MRTNLDNFQRLSDASSGSDSVRGSSGDPLGQLEHRVAQVEHSMHGLSDVKERLRILELCAAANGSRIRRNEWDQQVLVALAKASPNPLPIVAIVRHCGAASKKDMNRHLYDMQDRHLVYRTNPGEASPLWARSMVRGGVDVI